MSKIYKGDIGTYIKLDAGSSIVAATVKEIRYRKPDGTTGKWDAELSGAQVAFYVTKENDLDVIGLWEVQLYVEMPGWEGTGLQATFTVYDPVALYGEGEEEIQGNYIGEADVDNWTDAENKQEAIDRIEALIEKLTHDVFYEKDLVLTLDGNGKNRIFLGIPQDLISISEVLIDGSIVDTSYYTQDNDSVYSDESGVIFSKGVNNIQITCKVGWANTPAAIKKACVVLARAENDGTLYSRYSMLESEAVEGFSFKRPKKFLTGVLEADSLIHSYIRKKIILGAV